MINGIIRCVNASGELFDCRPSFSLQVPLMKATPVGRRGLFGRSVTLINTEFGG